MKNKFAVAMSVLIFNFSLPALADDAPQEIVITGQQPPPPPQYSSSAPVQTAVEMPKSSGDSQYSSEGYIKAKAEEAAAAEKGKKIQACYQQLAALDKSKFACSEDGDLIDVVQVVGVKDTGTSSAPSLVNEALYKELDNTRPTPPVIPKPESCSANAIAVELSACKLKAADTFKDANNGCVWAGGAVAIVGAGLGAYAVIRSNDPKVKASVTKSLAEVTAIGATIGIVVTQLCSSTYSGDKDVALAKCDLDEKTKLQECAKYD